MPMHPSMTSLPAWTSAEVARNVAEPFRSDGDFWSSLAASADALISLAAGTAVAIVLALTGEVAWSPLAFVIPALLIVRAAFVGRSSSQRSRTAFPDRAAWRDAERAAVATAFFRVMWRRRTG
jgi:hypothetical protein